MVFGYEIYLMYPAKLIHLTFNPMLISKYETEPFKCKITNDSRHSESTLLATKETPRHQKLKSDS